MRDSSSQTVVVGGGIAGLLCALLLSERHGLDVTIIERSSSLGGLLGQREYTDAGLFDLGMHNIYETGISELDVLLYGLLPDNDWQLLEDNKRDLAGSWFKGQLQVNSPYPDLRNVPVDLYSHYRREVLEAASRNDVAAENAIDDSIRLFGSRVTSDVIAPILAAQFRTEPRLLHRSSLWLTNIHRVLLLNERELIAKAGESGVRERIGFPEQRMLPTSWASGRRAFYPKRYGIYRVVEAITARLLSANVRILTSTEPAALEFGPREVEALVVGNRFGHTEKIAVANMYWTASSLALARLLGIKASKYQFDHPRTTWVVNALIPYWPRMEDLYYFFNYCPNLDTFRVTNYSAYCDGAPRNGQYPLAVELLLERDVSPDKVVAQATRELAHFGVIDDPNDVTFAAAEPLSAGIPLLTLANVQSSDGIQAAIESLDLKNLTILGLRPSRGIFFQRDVLSEVWHSLMGDTVK